MKRRIAKKKLKKLEPTPIKTDELDDTISGDYQYNFLKHQIEINEHNYHVGTISRRDYELNKQTFLKAIDMEIEKGELNGD